jgi:hypothetical protein
MKQEYKAANGAHISDAQAARYGNRINYLMEKRGFVTPQIVVEDAEKTNSPLHNYFTWNNDEAAIKWRIEQAKMLIRSIVVTVINEDKPEIRQFFSVTPSEEMNTEAKKVYVTLNTVMNDDAKKDEVITYALLELRGWRERYAQYSELDDLILGIDAGLKKRSA